MLVAMVTAPLRPAWATISASRSWNLAFSTTCLMPFFFSRSAEPLGFFYRSRAHQHRLALDRKLLDLVRGGEILLLLGAVDDVGILNAQHLLVGRNHHDFELVDLVEFGGFGFRRTGHAGQLLVHAEIILEGDGGERLVLALDLDAFFGFNRLVQAVGPAAARHHASGEFVDDDDFAVFDHIFHVLAIERVRLDRGLDVMFEWPVLGIGDVADAQQLLDFFPTLVGDGNVAVLLVDDEITGVAVAVRPGRPRFPRPSPAWE